MVCSSLLVQPSQQVSGQRESRKCDRDYVYRSNCSTRDWPLGTYIGQTFGWQTAFLIVALLGLIALIGSALLVPNNLKRPPTAKLSKQLKVLTQPRLLLVYAITALGYGGTFTAFYIPCTNSRKRVCGFDSSAISLIICWSYGVSVAVGNIWGKMAGSGAN